MDTYYIMYFAFEVCIDGFAAFPPFILISLFVFQGQLKYVLPLHEDNSCHKNEVN